MIKVAVFCSADDSYTQISEEIALKAAIKLNDLFDVYKHSDVCYLRDVVMIYGGGGSGLMGLAYDVAESKGIDVYANYMSCFPDDLSFGDPTKWIVHDNFPDRIKTMYDEANIIVVLPGGIGTLTELLLCMQMNQTRSHTKPIMLFNIDGYYDGILPYIETYCGVEECDVTIL